jgi:hypothetical protein
VDHQLPSASTPIPAANAISLKLGKGRRRADLVLAKADRTHQA